MPVALIDLNDTNNYGSVTGAWVVVLPSDTTPKAITDENGDPTGWTIWWSIPPGDIGGEGYNGVGVGDAAWCDEANVLRYSVFYNRFAAEDYCELIIEGPDELTIDAVGSYGVTTSHPDTEIWVNSETSQIMQTYDSVNARANNSEAVTFANVAKDANNQFVIRFRENSGDRGYIAAMRLTSTAGADTTAPVYESMPAVAETRDNGHTLAATLDEDGTIYAVRLPAGAATPTSAQVKAGQDSTGAAALEAVSVAASASTEAEMVFTTGSASTPYRYAVVAEDDETTPNIQATPVIVDATTAAAAVPGIPALTLRDRAGDLTPSATELQIAVRTSSDQSTAPIYSVTDGALDASSVLAAIDLSAAGVSVGDTVHLSYFNPANNEGVNINVTVGDIG